MDLCRRKKEALFFIALPEETNSFYSPCSDEPWKWIRMKIEVARSRVKSICYEEQNEVALY